MAQEEQFSHSDQKQNGSDGADAAASQFSGAGQSLNQNPTSQEPKKSARFLRLLFITLGALIFTAAAFTIYSAITNNLNTEPANNADEPSRLSRIITTIPPSLTATGYFAFNVDGSKVLYLGRADSPHTQVLMENDAPIGEFYSIDHLALSDDGLAINYIGLKKIREGGSVFVVNGVLQKYGGPSQSTEVAFSRDGRHYGYIADIYSSDKFRVIYDNEEIFIGDRPTAVAPNKSRVRVAFSTTLSPDGRRVGVVSQVGLRKQAAIIDTPSRVALADDLIDDILSNIVFSRDGKHYAYRARNLGWETIVIDGNSFTSFKYSGTASKPIFSFDSNKIAYIETGKEMSAFDLTTRGKTQYIAEEFFTREEIEQDSFDSFERDDFAIFPPVFDALGKQKASILVDNLASRQRSGQENPYVFYLEINGTRLNRLFSFISTPRFSADGKRIMFGVLENRDIKWLVYEITGLGFVEK